jgi:hypothetical protein
VAAGGLGRTRKGRGLQPELALLADCCLMMPFAYK